MSRDEAVKAAAVRMYGGRRWDSLPDDQRTYWLTMAAAAVDAVWPVIERAVRAQAAAEVPASRYLVVADEAARYKAERDEAIAEATHTRAQVVADLSTRDAIDGLAAWLDSQGTEYAHTVATEALAWAAARIVEGP